MIKDKEQNQTKENRSSMGRKKTMKMMKMRIMIKVLMSTIITSVSVLPKMDLLLLLVVMMVNQVMYHPSSFDYLRSRNFPLVMESLNIRPEKMCFGKYWTQELKDRTIPKSKSLF